MNKKVGIIVGITVAALLGGAAVMSMSNKNDKEIEKAEETIVVTDRRGEVTVTKDPERVVVLDYSSLDTMSVIGEEAIAVPKSSLPVYLESYKDEKYTDLGSLKKFDMEKINELDPDLIIIEGRQEDSYEELSEIAPTIMLGRNGSDHFGSLEHNVQTLGKIFDKEEEATAKIESIQNRTNAIASKTENLEGKALVTMVYDGEITAFGAESRFGMIHNEFGFKQADENIDTENHGQTVTSEYVLSKNPDYLFVVDKGLISSGEQKPAKEIVENELVQKTKAFKTGSITYLDTKAWYLGGPGINATEKMLTEIEASIK
ncbi:ABC transporter substrate-binding protein [uncultured Clostridium sp.]|jgi:iron complex transport system substrate-binding protein|uniref:siderophore ABC transporter substrate-binding protein n=1 Tax=uncultured Clostridium sp. TaxID=59620 RepID=UPI002626AC4A|nr:ABC transporter substrate-binding protein [uncultured Clostridium sp.]